MGSRVIDNFLSGFDQFREHCLTLDYSGVQNPQDGIVYPDISLDIPLDVKAEIQSKIEDALGYAVDIKTLFIRKSSKGVHVPNIVHSDLEMGAVSLMLYLNDLDDCVGGTAFMVHKYHGLNRHPINNTQIDLLNKSANDFDKWSIIKNVNMTPNRALIFDSGQLHCALPVGGFGETSQDSRLVLTAFMDIV